MLCQLIQFRREYVRRRTLIYGGGCSAAKPPWPEVIIFLDVLLRQGNPLTGGEPLPEKRVVPAISAPARECSPEEGDLRAAVVRRSQAVLR